jgi:hypothetical protein
MTRGTGVAFNFRLVASLTGPKSFPILRFTTIGRMSSVLWLFSPFPLVLEYKINQNEVTNLYQTVNA